MSQQPIATVGPMRPDERNFVLASVKQSLRQQPVNQGVPKGTFFDRANADYQRLFERPTLRVLVARSPNDESFIRGFVVFEVTPSELIVDYVYTRSGFRRLGLARELLAIATADVSETLPLVTSARTRFDDIAERYGFTYIPMTHRLAIDSKEAA